jgi:hypothetical protein
MEVRKSRLGTPGSEGREGTADPTLERSGTAGIKDSMLESPGNEPRAGTPGRDGSEGSEGLIPGFTDALASAAI